MAFSHGSKAIFKIGTHAAPTVVTDLSTYANSVGVTMSRDSGEVSTFGVSSKQYVPGLKDATVPFEGPFDPTADQILWDDYNFGDIVNFEYYPSGVATGNIKYSGKMFVTSYEVSSGVGDPNAVSGEFQVTGDVARAVQP
jgi:hypothetical protein